MIILSCETSTLLGSVAVLENTQVLACEESMRQGSHSDVLNIFIERALKKANKNISDVNLFVSGIGPGSFTGIRISLNTAKTLAYCSNRPTMGINSLESLAYQAQISINSSEFENTQIISMINAYKNMLYVSTFCASKDGLVQLKSPEVIRVQNLSHYITQKSVVCGDGYNTYEKYISDEVKKNIIRIPEVSDESHAKNLGLLAQAKLSQDPSVAQAWHQLLPLYLRASEAEENLKGIKYQPLF